jgi:hypothetical protein
VSRGSTNPPAQFEPPTAMGLSTIAARSTVGSVPAVAPRCASASRAVVRPRKGCQAAGGAFEVGDRKQLLGDRQALEGDKVERHRADALRRTGVVDRRELGGEAGRRLVERAGEAAGRRIGGGGGVGGRIGRRGVDGVGELGLRARADEDVMGRQWTRHRSRGVGRKQRRDHSEGRERGPAVQAQGQACSDHHQE